MKQIIPDVSPEDDSARAIERPDGFYWQTQDGAREYGPFPTLLDAMQDMQVVEEEALEPGETPQEAQAEIGIADWVDPDTGEPAEVDGRYLEDH
jgi:hypothetical protein